MRFISPVAVTVGALTWSLAEYSIHRFVGHGKPKPRAGKRQTISTGDFGVEHLKHHVDPTYFTPTSAKAVAAASVLGVGGAIGSLVVGPRLGISFALGLASAYVSYEVTHRRTHTHAPTGAYSRWVRKNHLYHHYGSPKVNHGVTSPLWDLVFRTHVGTDRIRVPDVRAPSWLVDERGDVRSAFATDYELVKKTKKPTMKPRAF